MKNHLSLIRRYLLVQTFWIILFALFFTFVGYYLPRIYLKYFDKRDYYRLELPLVVEKPLYKPCEIVRFTTKRTSDADLYIRVHGEIVYTQSGNFERVFSKEEYRTVRKGTAFISHSYQLPCDMPSGTFYLNGTVVYDIQGVSRYYYIISQTFEVRR